MNIKDTLSIDMPVIPFQDFMDIKKVEGIMSYTQWVIEELFLGFLYNFRSIEAREDLVFKEGIEQQIFGGKENLRAWAEVFNGHSLTGETKVDNIRYEKVNKLLNPNSPSTNDQASKKNLLMCAIQ